MLVDEFDYMQTIMHRRSIKKFLKMNHHAQQKTHAGESDKLKSLVHSDDDK